MLSPCLKLQFVKSQGLLLCCRQQRILQKSLHHPGPLFGSGDPVPFIFDKTIIAVAEPFCDEPGIGRRDQRIELSRKHQRGDSTGNGFNLEESLLKLPLKLENPEEKKRITESLQRGNRQAVTLDVQGKDRKIFVEAAPQFKSLNYYNEQGKRLQLQSVLQNPEQAFGERQTANQSKKQKAGKPDDDLEDAGKKKKTKRHQVSH